MPQGHNMTFPKIYDIYYREKSKMPNGKKSMKRTAYVILLISLIQ